MNLSAVSNSLSRPRISTYLHIQKVKPPSLEKAFQLYIWNSELSAAVFINIASCEIVIRNAASEAIANVYGSNWPNDNGFKRTLNHKADTVLEDAIKKAKNISTDKIIAELNFGFWENMFRKTFDSTIWSKEIFNVFPNLKTSDAIKARKTIAKGLNEIRLLRNRISHHEPIIKKPIQSEIDTIQKLVKYRCKDTAAWIAKNSNYQNIIKNKPIF